MSSPGRMSRLGAVLRCLWGRPVLFIHTKTVTAGEIRSGRYGFMNTLMEVAASRDLPHAFMPHGRGPYLARWGRPAIHLYVTFGRAPRGPGVLVASPAYLNNYWYLDPLGHREAPTIAQAAYDPDKVDAEAANDLFRRLRRRFVRKSETSRPQPKAGQADIPDGAIAILLQFHKDHERPIGAVCSEVEMIRAVVAARGDRPVVIKRHPHGASVDVDREIADHTAHPDVTCVEANVHDILSAAHVVCTYNSAAGFEAMLHRVPTLLFADADYHHGAIRVRDMADLPRLLVEAGTRSFNYPKYLHWFVNGHLFHPDQPDCAARIAEALNRVLAQPRS